MPSNKLNDANSENSHNADSNSRFLIKENSHADLEARQYSHEKQQTIDVKDLAKLKNLHEGESKIAHQLNSQNSDSIKQNDDNNDSHYKELIDSNLTQTVIEHTDEQETSNSEQVMFNSQQPIKQAQSTMSPHDGQQFQNNDEKQTVATKTINSKVTINDLEQSEIGISNQHSETIHNNQPITTYGFEATDTSMYIDTTELFTSLIDEMAANPHEQIMETMYQQYQSIGSLANTLSGLFMNPSNPGNLLEITTNIQQSLRQIIGDDLYYHGSFTEGLLEVVSQFNQMRLMKELHNHAEHSPDTCCISPADHTMEEMLEMGIGTTIDSIESSNEQLFNMFEQAFLVEELGKQNFNEALDCVLQDPNSLKILLAEDSFLVKSLQIFETANVETMFENMEMGTHYGHSHHEHEHHHHEHEHHHHEHDNIEHLAAAEFMQQEHLLAQYGPELLDVWEQQNTLGENSATSENWVSLIEEHGQHHQNHHHKTNIFESHGKHFPEHDDDCHDDMHDHNIHQH